MNAERSNIKPYLLGLLRKHWLFIMAFILMAAYLKTTGPMTNISGDAAGIWETIKSFAGEGEIVPSYVLYKGFASVYPYVWLYKLSLLMGLHEFAFIKLYHCLLFAYVSAVGFPYLIEKLLKIDTKNWRKAVFIVLIFLFWKSNLAFSQLMVDLPSLAYFILLVNTALKVTAFNNKRSYGRYIYTGLLLGLNICLSGQYTLAAMAVLVYVLIKALPRNVLKDKLKRFGALTCAVIVIISMLGVRAYNGHFEKTVINPLRASGAWIPTGKQWVTIDFFRLIGVQRAGTGLSIPDNRGLSILKDLYGDQYEQAYEAALNGAIGLSYIEYIKLVLDYPLDFLTRYANRLFISLIPDGGSPNFTRLFLTFTFLFSSFLSLIKRCKNTKQFFNKDGLIVISFIFAVVPLAVLTVELRCVMQIQGLIYAVGILDNQIWEGFRSFGKVVNQCWIKRSVRILGERPFPYTFFTYLIFMIFCFIHTASLYELIGVDPAILFKF